MQLNSARLDPKDHSAGVTVTMLDITDYQQAQEDYHNLFEKMLDGFAVHEIICDDAGRPVDYRFLAVNPAFEAHDRPDGGPRRGPKVCAK